MFIRLFRRTVCPHACSSQLTNRFEPNFKAIFRLLQIFLIDLIWEVDTSLRRNTCGASLGYEIFRQPNCTCGKANQLFTKCTLRKNVGEHRSMPPIISFFFFTVAFSRVFGKSLRKSATFSACLPHSTRFWVILRPAALILKPIKTRRTITSKLTCFEPILDRYFLLSQGSKVH